MAGVARIVPPLLHGKNSVEHTYGAKKVYAIVRDRGMQYRVEAGKTLDIALRDVEKGSEIVFDEVLLIGGTDEVKVGTPLVDGATVRAQVLDTVKGEKIVVFRYRSKKRYRRRTGHRQRFTRVQISDISG